MLVQEEQLYGPATSVTLHFVKLNGSPIRSYRLPNDTALLTVGGSSVFFVQGTELRSVDSSASVADHGALAGLTMNPPYDGGLVASPDGRRWAWSAVDTVGNNLRSRLYLGGENTPTRLVDECNHACGDSYLEPVLWSPAGIVVVDQPGGIGGFPLFFDDDYWWNSTLLDADNLTKTPLTDSQSCPFSDVGADGSWTCSQRATRSVELHPSGGMTQRFAIRQPAYEIGNALISSDRQSIAVGFDNTEGAGNTTTYDLGTMTIAVSTGTAQRVGPLGDVPAAWLPDGSLILQDEEPRDGYPRAHCDLLTPAGTTTRLGQGGFVGVLDPVASIPSRTPAG